MKIGDKVKCSYGIGEIITINGKFASVKIGMNAIPIEMDISSLKPYLPLTIGAYVRRRMDNEFGIVEKIEDGLLTVKLIKKANTKADFFQAYESQVENIGFDYESYRHNGHILTKGSLVEFNNTSGRIVGLLKESAIISINNEYKIIHFKKLKVLDDLNDEALVEEIASDDFSIIPSNYSNFDSYTKLSKLLLNWLKTHYEHGKASIQSFEDAKGGIMGVFIDKMQGIIVFQMFETVTLENFSNIFESFSFTYLVKKEWVINRFYASSVLCDFDTEGKKILKYPLRFVYLFPNIQYQELDDAEKELLAKYPNMYCRNFKSNFPIFDKAYFEPYNDGFSEVDQKLYDNIIERILPENCTTLMKTEKNNIIKVKATNYRDWVSITGEEKEFKALSLDDSEIQFINNTKPGHWITLANPGTGKSVILLSKAYRLFYMNKDWEKPDNHMKILITCFNDNLCLHHKIFSERTGLNDKDIHIFTFHSLLHKTLKELHKLPSDYDKINDMSDKMEALVKKAYEAVYDKDFIPPYDAIFIDEVQLFQPNWIEICKKMLKLGGYFELYGDLNQNVKTKSIGMNTPWKDKRLGFNWQGHTRYLSKNYRNSRKINDYLNLILTRLNNSALKYNPNFDLDDARLVSKASREGVREVKVLSVSDNKMAEKVASLVVQMKENWNEIDEDIAIIFPAKKMGKYYQPFYWITQELSKRNINYCQIFGDSDVKTKIGDINGVVLTTVDSSLGLDFKNVIFCGTNCFDTQNPGQYPKIQLTEQKLKEHNKDAITAYCEYGRKIYSACSRARDVLIVVDDLPASSPLKKLLVKE